MATIIRNLFILFLVFLFLSMGLSAFFIENRLPEKGYNVLLNKIDTGAIFSLDVTGTKVDVETKSGASFRVFLPDDHSWVESGIDLKKIKVSFHKDYTSYYFNGGLALTVTITLLVLFLSAYRKPQNGDDLQFAKDRLILPSAGPTTVSFDDVAGMPDAIEELQEVVAFLKDPQQFQNVGGHHTKGSTPPGATWYRKDASCPSHCR